MKKLLLLTLCSLPVLAQETIDHANAQRVTPWPVRNTFPGFGRLGDHFTYTGSGQYGSIAIYNSALTAVQCQTTPIAATGTAQLIKFSWTCSSLPAGFYWVVTTADGVNFGLSSFFSNSTGSLDSLSTSPVITGSSNTGCVSTGTGASLAFNTSISACAWTAGGGTYTPPIIAGGN